MIGAGTLFKVVDNSGVRVVNTIKVLSKGKAKVGDVVVVSVRRVKSNAMEGRRKLVKGEVRKGLIVRLRRANSRKIGIYGGAKERGVVLLKKGEMSPVGNRMRGPVFVELREKGFFRLMIMATAVL